MRLKLAGTTVTTGVQLLYRSGVEIFIFFSLYSPLLPMGPGHMPQSYEIGKKKKKSAPGKPIKTLKPAEKLQAFGKKLYQG